MSERKIPDDLVCGDKESLGMYALRLRDEVIAERERIADLTAENERLKAQTQFLDQEFLDAMNDVGRYGFEKYGQRSFHALRLSGSRARDARLSSQSIADHARAHFDEYLSFHTHDHFGTDIHQLAACAFNAMMESYLANRAKEQAYPYCGPICYEGAAHNARKEDGAFYKEPK